MNPILGVWIFLLLDIDINSLYCLCDVRPRWKITDPYHVASAGRATHIWPHRQYGAGLLRIVSGPWSSSRYKRRAHRCGTATTSLCDQRCSHGAQTTIALSSDTVCGGLKKSANRGAAYFSNLPSGCDPCKDAVDCLHSRANA